VFSPLLEGVSTGWWLQLTPLCSLVRAPTYNSSCAAQNAAHPRSELEYGLWKRMQQLALSSEHTLRSHVHSYWFIRYTTNGCLKIHHILAIFIIKHLYYDESSQLWYRVYEETTKHVCSA
jgi:hypothetical protein